MINDSTQRYNDNTLEILLGVKQICNKFFDVGLADAQTANDQKTKYWIKYKQIFAGYICVWIR